VDVIGRKMASVRVIGPHPKDKADIQVRKGRFGPYVQHGQVVANLPKTATMDDITLDQAIALLAERGKVLKPKGKNGKNGKAKKAAPAKPAPAPKAKKPSAKAPPVRKAS
jgi:DNA topoisomerase-1